MWAGLSPWRISLSLELEETLTRPLLRLDCHCEWHIDRKRSHGHIVPLDSETVIIALPAGRSPRQSGLDPPNRAACQRADRVRAGLGSLGFVLNVEVIALPPVRASAECRIEVIVTMKH